MLQTANMFGKMFIQR